MPPERIHVINREFVGFLLVVHYFSLTCLWMTHFMLVKIVRYSMLAVLKEHLSHIDDNLNLLLSSLIWHQYQLTISIFWETVEKSCNNSLLTERLEKTAAGYDMEIGCDKSEILVNSIKPRPSIHQYTDEWKSVGRSGQAHILRIHTNKERTSIGEVKVRLVQAYSAMTMLAILSQSVFPQRLNSSYEPLVLSTLMYGCESWTLAFDTERCLTCPYLIDSIKRTNT